VTASTPLYRQQTDAGDETHVIVLLGPGPDQRPACLEHDPELFFSTGTVQQARAKAICAGCPRLRTCRDEAMATTSGGKPWGEFGVWGGLTAQERRDARKPKKERSRRGGRGRRRAA
jgi:WhiB family redox-sensing transcriptional regulator